MNAGRTHTSPQVNDVSTSVIPNMENVSIPVVESAQAVKVHRSTLILQGKYEHCAHCGLKLTDSVSIESGIGPICRRNGGYYDEPEGGDEIQAFIVLSDYPDLIQFLTDNYKPKGQRALMNGLVGCCALNRKKPVHKACCEAIEALGFKRLASTLRKSLSTVKICKSDRYPGSFQIRIIKRDYNPMWAEELKRSAYGVFFSREEKSLIVPINKPDNATELAVNGDMVPNKQVLWESLVKYYEGLFVETPEYNFEIKRGAAVPAISP